MSKTILITGASSGFGRDTAETLFRAGHTVYASMRSRATSTVVGAACGSDKANKDIAPVQAHVVEALGLSYLEKIA